ncbi:MAG TPA: hypothetical protein VML55_15960 [Planctomycetaceae bacterium]|nr:hypothetical protein [Planctomycetaceae bacterium]
MQTIIRAAAALGLMILGYVLGVSGLFAPSPAAAQIQPADQYADATREKVKAVYESVASAMATLEQEGLYRPAIQGVNAFAVSTGGVDVLHDLETSQSVDPETFVGLYAGLAVDDVAQHLSYDEDGRVLYKNRPVRLYPISRIHQLIARRRQLAGIEEDPLAPKVNR